MIDLVSEANARRRTALVVGVQTPGEDPEQLHRELDELGELAANLDYIVLEPLLVKSSGSHIRYLMGSGKAAEVAQAAQESEADTIIFDVRLTPSQQRNWERLSACRVLDREEIILDIFAERAHTREAVLQVELARAQYHLPRLTKAWSHLSRQRGGGSTTRGEGEAQLETDRRILRRRIQELREELEVVHRRRQTQRKARQRRPVPQAALVGYTNVGKSSLLHALTGADVLVKDQLFATLDPTARRVELPGGGEVVLADTVGFIRRLPHQLIEAFKSTLEEATLADCLLLVLDISSPELESEWETTLSVLRELGADEKRIITILNKVDRLDRENDALHLARCRGLFPDAITVSAATGEGLDELKQRLAETVSGGSVVLKVKLPPSRHDLAAFIHANGRIGEESYDEEGNLHMVFAIEVKHQHRFTGYQIL